MRSFRVGFILLLVILAIAGCVGSVSMSVPIGNPWPYGGYGGVTIGSGSVYF